MTFNILVDFSYEAYRDYDIPFWYFRKQQLADVISQTAPDILALQEPIQYQLSYLEEKLGDGYGTIKNPYFTDAAMMYKKDKFDVVASGHWWLSTTPEASFSRSFGNLWPSLVVWAKLKHRATGQLLYAYATHFPAMRIPKIESSKLVSSRLKDLYKENIPVLLIGDFNIDSDHEAYPLLTGEGLLDSYKLFYKDREDPKLVTFYTHQIDHVFVYPETAVVPQNFQVLPTIKQRLSDHNAVVVDLRIMY